MNAQVHPIHPGIVPPVQSPAEAVTRAEALAASLDNYRPQVRQKLGSLAERAAEATAAYEALTRPVEDYEAPFFDAPVSPPYPEPDCPVDKRYRANVLGLLTAGCLLAFAGCLWLAGLLFTAFT